MLKPLDLSGVKPGSQEEQEALRSFHAERDAQMKQRHEAKVKLLAEHATAAGVVAPEVSRDITQEIPIVSVSKSEPVEVNHPQ